MTLMRIEYPQGGAFEVEGKDIEELERLINTALTILWGRKKYGSNAVSIKEIDEWLRQTNRNT